MDIIKTKITDEIEVQHVFHAKPTKGESYAIFVHFYVLLKTIRVDEMAVSTGVTTPKNKWTTEGTIKGSDIFTKTKNERLRQIIETMLPPTMRQFGNHTGLAPMIILPLNIPLFCVQTSSAGLHSRWFSIVQKQSGNGKLH